MMRLNYKFELFTLIGLVLLFLTVPYGFLYAAESGKIAGRVIDDGTGEPLAGANVIIEGKTLGASADLEGFYFILNVPPGKYIVVAQMVGYEKVQNTDALVQMGKTTTLNFNLSQTILEGEMVTIIAERPVIQTDVANTQTILQGSDVAAIPVSNFKDVLDKQLGVQEVDARGLFMRGQRQDDISLTIDGTETRENIDGQIYTRFNPDEVEQAEINAGGSDVGRGNATAGAITIVTKEGGNTYSATFDYRISNADHKHFGPRIRDYWDQQYLVDWVNDYQYADWKPPITGNPDDTLANRWEFLAHNLEDDDPFKDRPELLKELYRWWTRDEATDYGNKSDYVLNATFGGPVPLLENTTFFSSYRTEKNYYLYPGPLDHFFDQNAMFKLTTHPSKSTKLSFNFRYTESTGLNRYDYYRDEASRGDFSTIDPDFQTEKRYLFEGVDQVAWSGYGAWPYTAQIGHSTRFRRQFGLGFTWTLNSRTFCDFKVLYNNFHSYGNQSAERDVAAEVTLTDPADPDYTVTLTGPHALAPLGFWEQSVPNQFGWVLGGTYGYSEDNFAKDLTFRANLTSQVDRYNQVDAGFQYSYYEIKKRENRDMPDRLDKWRWHVYPQSIAFWANDKVEFKGLILNAGIRADVRIPDEWLDWKSDPYNPIWRGDMPADTNLAGPKYQPSAKIVLAPRLSISHPIGETAKIFFNWGHYYQEQPFERLYLFYRRDALQQVSYGDPELPFKKSIKYEVGYEHNVQNIFRIAISGYYKDVKNLLMDRTGYRDIIRSDGSQYEEPNLYTYGANRYINTRGVEVRLEKRTGKFWTGWFNYSLLFYSRGVYGFRTFYQDPTIPSRPYDYAAENKDRPSESRFNLGLIFHTPPQYGSKSLGFHPLADINLSFLLVWRQQPTFTYNPNRIPAPYAPRDNKRWKAHWSVNMTFSKRFDFDMFVTPVLYLEVYNLFNNKNMWRGAFNENDAALEKYVGAVENEGGDPGERGDLAQEAIGNNPTQMLPFNGSPYFLYLNPRQIWFGIRFEFQ
jgi:hypothetical protein